MPFKSLVHTATLLVLIHAHYTCSCVFCLQSVMAVTCNKQHNKHLQ